MGTYFPFNYEKLNLDTAYYTPNTLYYNSRSFCYWNRSLFERIKSVIDIEGLPEEITAVNGAEDLLYFSLVYFGFVAFLNDKNVGLIFSPCSPSGYNVYYSPTKILINNPSDDLSKDEYEIGTECELLKMTADYHGLYDIICRYAEKLANIDNAIDMSINNSKLAYIGYPKNKAAAEALKLVYDKIMSGEPSVYMHDNQMKILPDIKQGTSDSESPLQFTPVLDVKANYILDALLRDQQTLLNEFDTEIGIPSVKDKKERMLTDEINTPIIDSQARALNWIENLNASAENVNNMFGLNISAKLHFDDMIGANIQDQEKEGDFE